MHDATYTTVEDATDAYRQAIVDTVRDAGFDAYRTITIAELRTGLVLSIAGMSTREVAATLCRTELGEVPTMIDMIHTGLSKEE